MKSRHPILLLFALAMLATPGCGRESPLAPTQTGLKSGSAALRQAAWAAGNPVHIEGEIGPGALYSIDVPENWNGDLVLYAHGYTTVQEPVGLPQGAFPGIRDQMLSRGFAIATTSYSSNGFAEAEGARQVHQLRGLFTSRVQAPTRTFLVGSSLGGLISVDLLQSFPDQYAGALSVSGPLGGTRAEFQYVGDVRLLYDLLMPCPLPGTFAEVPAIPLPQNDIVACILQNQQKFGILVSTRREGGFPVAGNNANELVTSVVSTIGFQWYGMGDGIDRAHGHMVYDNHDAVYVSGVLPPQVLAGINAGIARYTATPDAANFLRQHYEPPGVLERPLLTIHAERDRLVPWGHEQLLLDRVTAAGDLGNLSQSHYARFGHTEAFSAADVAAAFDALVAWTDTGVKPASPVPLGP
jgi:pimeloyl-ACP methyl ester carboxylesterase